MNAGITPGCLCTQHGSREPFVVVHISSERSVGVFGGGDDVFLTMAILYPSSMVTITCGGKWRSMLDVIVP